MRYPHIAAVVLAILVVLGLCPAQADEPRPDFLTQEERQWLAEHPVIRLGVGTAFPPYQWVEQDKGAPVFKGVVSEYVRLLEDRLQVKLAIVFGIPFGQALEMGRKREIDLFPCLAPNVQRSEFLLFSEPYISYPSVIITRDDAPVIGGMQDLRGRRVALVKDQIIHSLVMNQFAHLNLTIVETENAEQDLKAVSFGKADACLMDLGVASYFIQKLRITNLKIAAPTEFEKIALAMGVRNDWPMLQSIIQKTLHTITSAEKDAINQRWIQLKYEPGISPRVVMQWGAVAGLGIVVVFLGQFLLNWKLRREIQARKRIEEERNALITDLKMALSEVKTLQGFLPICSNCRKIRSDSGYWQQIELYIQEHTDAQFSHSICPDCLHQLYPGMADAVLKKCH